MTTLFIDEGKRRDYLLVAAVVVDEDIKALRAEVAKLRKPGEERIHFVKASDGRRRTLLETYRELGVTSVVFRATGLNDRVAREWCLRQAVDLAAETKSGRIVIETDDSIVRTDKRTLYQAVREQGLHDTLNYEHQRASSEPLLWLPDAIAWGYGRGGEWLRRAKPLITRVVDHPT